MLLFAFAVLVLVVAGTAAVAKVAHATMLRLGLDPMNVLLFFGLAESQEDELAARRDAPVRRSRPVRAG